MMTSPDENHAVLDAESIARLKHINVQLDALQIQIHELAKACRVQLAQAASNLGHPTDDICIEAELAYNLSPSDPRYDPTFEHSENRVACRTLYCTDSPDLLNFGIHEPHSVIGPQGWLFHDLTEHDNGPDQPPVAPAELLNVDSIDVNLEIRYSMRVKLDTDMPLV